MSLGQSTFHLIRALRAQKYDLVIDMQGLLKSGTWSLLSGGKTRIGLGSKEGSRYLMTDVIGLSQDDKRISSEYKVLLEKLDTGHADYAIGIQPSQEDIHNSHALLSNYMVRKDYAVVCPFTTRAQKHWPLNNWLKLIPELQTMFGVDVVLLGGPNDLSSSKEFEMASARPPVNLTGKTRMLESLAIVQRASLVIGVDTGLTHMGMLSHIPTVAIFGSTCPYLKPDNQHGIVLYANLPCSPCKRNPLCSEEYSCMHEIDEAMVLRAAKKVYQK
jgi:heptosyltransferase-1